MALWLSQGYPAKGSRMGWQKSQLSSQVDIGGGNEFLLTQLLVVRRVTSRANDESINHQVCVNSKELIVTSF